MALPATPDESEEHRVKRHPGRLFFGYFLLATQKKVSRLSVREPTLKWLREAFPYLYAVKPPQYTAGNASIAKDALHAAAHIL